jgi:crotonobetainyl-CoA:carnitine CoA-transferase CaiB-like acyl-CoA transferase
MAHDSRILKHEERIEEIRKGLPDWIVRLQRPPTPSLMPKYGPLEGIRAVGTGVLVAQPYIGTKLAEFGAEVIHVERPGGDTFRTTAPFLTRGPRPHGCDEAEVAKNKLSMGVDLKHARGIELLMALWKISDIWMEASAPGTLERNGITNELALAINPSLIILRISTYGQYGEADYLGRPGYDALAQAFGGMMNVTGDPAGPPQRAKVFTGDYITALTGWAATMMALWEVKKSGRGQVIDLAQYEAVAQTQGNCMPLYTGQGVTYGHTGNRAPGFQPYDTFKCSDGCKEFDRRLREYCAGKTTLEAENELNAARIGCARVLNPADQYSDRQYNAREMTVPVLDRQSGVPVRVYGVVPKMSLTPGRIWRGAASIGEDTTDILSSLLGLPQPEIDQLYSDEVVHRTEPFTTPQVAAVHP